MEGIFAIAIAAHMAYGRVDSNTVNSIRRSLDLSSGKATYIINPNVSSDNIYDVEVDKQDMISVSVEIRLRPSNIQGMFGSNMVANPKADSYIDALVKRIPNLRIIKSIHEFMVEVLTNNKKDEIDFTVVADGVSGSSSKNTIKGDVQLKISARSKTQIPKDLREPISFSIKTGEASTKSTVSNMGIFVGLFRLCKTFKLQFVEGLEEIEEFPDRYSKMQELVYQHPDKITDEGHIIHYVKKYMSIQDRYYSGGGDGDTDIDKKVYQARDELEQLKATLKRFIQSLSEEIEMKDSERFTTDPRSRVFTKRCLDFIRSQIFGQDMAKVISIKGSDVKEIDSADFDAMMDKYVINLQTDDSGIMRFYGIDINNVKTLLFQIRPRLEYNLKNGKKTQILMVEVGDLL
jgi:HAMP domain-containing protein